MGKLAASVSILVGIVGCQQILGIDDGDLNSTTTGQSGTAGMSSGGGGGVGGRAGTGGEMIPTATCADTVNPIVGSAMPDVENPAAAMVCNPTNIEIEDGAVVGLVRSATGDTALYSPSSNDELKAGACVEVDFGQVVMARGARLVLNSAEIACGHSCSGLNCGTGHYGLLFSSTDATTPATTWTVVPNYIDDFFPTGGADLHELIISFGDEPVGMRHLLACRANEGALRDSLEIDSVQLCRD